MILFVWFVSGPSPRAETVVICHALSSKGFVENFPFILRKKTFHAICGWFENTLTVNLPKGRKVVVVMDSAKYHCRFIAKAPSMKMKKGEVIAAMSKHDLEISNAIPTKLVLLE